MFDQEEGDEADSTQCVTAGDNHFAADCLMSLDATDLADGEPRIVGLTYRDIPI
jgi:hypothetical protein